MNEFKETQAQLQNIRLSSSLRNRPIEETLDFAIQWANKLGITRVTDITRLDRIGIPVFTSIRPTAQVGSLCVNAGKGILPEEARIGAYMEAIEFAMAEFGASSIPVIAATARDVFDGPNRPSAVLDFCPKMKRAIPLDKPMPCVEAEEISSGQKFLVPAELVFLPAPRHLITERYFGAGSNGLASGNTVLEATVHGLAELIERDICSFHCFDDSSALIDPATFPQEATNLRSQIVSQGMELFVRHQPNFFDVPWFSATIVDPDHLSPYFINGGYGCHPNASIAIVRAICEAAQSRLSFIHGGRDDLAERHDRFSSKSPAEVAKFVDDLITKVSKRERVSDFQSVHDHPCDNLQMALEFLTSSLRQIGLKHVLRVCYTQPEDTLQVVRIIVPGLENFTESTARIGPRLRSFLQSQRHA